MLQTVKSFLTGRPGVLWGPHQNHLRAGGRALHHGQPSWPEQDSCRHIALNWRAACVSAGLSSKQIQPVHLSINPTVDSTLSKHLLFPRALLPFAWGLSMGASLSPTEWASGNWALPPLGLTMQLCAALENNAWKPLTSKENIENFTSQKKKKKKAQIRADKGEKHQLLTGSQQAKCSKLKIHSLEKCGVNKIILIEEACVCNQNERLYLYSSITATWNKGIKTFLKYNESEVWPVFHQKS